MHSLDLNDVQGNILKGYRMPTARYTFLRIDDGAAGRALLEDLIPHITTSEPWPKDEHKKVIKPQSTLNIGFTYRGLAALGLPAASLATFPVEFQQGMKPRAHELGDDGESAPEHWDPMWQQDVHVWISINALDDASLDCKAAWLLQRVAAVGGVVELGRQYAARLDGGKEHFGFTDGISNPQVAAVDTRQETTLIGKLTSNGQWEPLATGEFLLGQPDEALEASVGPQPILLARNGTFMVYRKLHQKVASFRRYLREEGAKYGNPELLAARMVGRWPNGTPLALSPDKPDDSKIRDNSFTYADDPDGLKCPMASHVRRSNPRDSLGFGGVLTNRRRIIRRGLPYGQATPPDQPGDDDGEHGVIFMALGASIERQFEFTQAAWINGGNNLSLGADKDPIAGNHHGRGRMVVPGSITGDDVKPPYICANLPRFVVTRGGDYFFVPSMTALRLIARNRVDPR